MGDGRAGLPWGPGGVARVAFALKWMQEHPQGDPSPSRSPLCGGKSGSPTADNCAASWSPIKAPALTREFSSLLPHPPLPNSSSSMIDLIASIAGCASSWGRHFPTPSPHEVELCLTYYFNQLHYWNKRQSKEIHRKRLQFPRTSGRERVGKSGGVPSRGS